MANETARRPLMAGNWKMNLDHFEATHLVQKLAWELKDKEHDYDSVEVVVVPPFTDIRSVQTLVDGDKLEIKYGAQDVSAHESGAYTGEISAAMLARLGVSYVVVGHSERRQYHAEDDALVGAKAQAALKHGISPIICVGEGLDVRQAGEQVAYTLARSTARMPGWTPRPRSRRSSPTSRSGRSAPARWPPRRTRRRSAAPSGPGWPSCTTRRSPTPSGCSTAAR